MFTFVKLWWKKSKLKRQLARNYRSLISNGAMPDFGDGHSYADHDSALREMSVYFQYQGLTKKEIDHVIARELPD